jgi:polyisoprenoid-binding protein YceI
MKKVFFIPILSLLFFASCSTNNSNETIEESGVQECYYTINEGSVKVNWVAYKFTEKTPVEGAFDDVKITGLSTLNDLDELINGLSFEIPVASLNSNNPERDEKIKNTFFGALKETPVLKGYVVSVNGDEVVLSLSLNGFTKEVVGQKTFESGIYTFKATLDLKVFDAGFAVQALNKLCYDLHIGADGISKLWDEVEIRFQCAVKEDC